MRIFYFLFLYFCDGQNVEKGIANNLQISIDVLSNTEPNDKKYVFKINFELDADSTEILR